MGPLPQIYADQFGWKEMAQVVADAYHKLPPEEQKGCAIFGQNYGQAGAIDFFGAKIGIAAGDFRAPELFLLGSARIFGRVHDCDG